MLLKFSSKAFIERIENFKHLLKRKPLPGTTKITSIKGKTIVVTGTLVRYNRMDITYILEKAGAWVENKVNKNTDYVVITDKQIKSGHKTTKWLTAERLGINIVSENDLYEFLDS